MTLGRKFYFMGLILQVHVSGCNLGDGAKELHQTALRLILQLKCVKIYSVVYLECYKHHKSYTIYSHE